ncbi:hypothetical protein EDB89DRAFT_2078646 [Lactarius sanguifluus]|nr:hypothetical protein EDB89DRAFT_2078646 [Lactarius sanguifluus]
MFYLILLEQKLGTSIGAITTSTREYSRLEKGPLVLVRVFRHEYSRARGIIISAATFLHPLAAPVRVKTLLFQPDEDANDSEEPEYTAPQDPDRRTLHEALGASNRVSGLDHSAQAQLDEYSYAAACLSFEDQEKIESLPDEDPEMQAVLMQRVLEIVMEVENLTATEKAQVQDNLTSICPHTLGPFTQSSQPSAALDPTLDSETFSDLSTLIRGILKGRQLTLV